MAQVATAAVETPGQKVVTAFDKPLKPTGGLAILRGNLAPEGCVVKLAGHERLLHRGPARVFDNVIRLGEPPRTLVAACQPSARRPHDMRAPGDQAREVLLNRGVLPHVD